MRLLPVLAGPLAFLTKISADTPANCMIEEIYGKWTFQLSENIKTLNCTNIPINGKQVELELSAPNLVKDEMGNQGYFTMIYNQGFQIMVGGHVYFAFFEWSGPLPYLQGSENSNDAQYNCHKTMPGWAENIIGSDNACFVGTKQEKTSDNLNFNSNELLIEKNQNTNFMQRPKGKLSAQVAADRLAQNFKIDQDLVDRINSIPDHQNTWKADVYENLWTENLSILQAKQYGGNFVADRKILKSQVSQHSENHAESPYQGAYLVQEHADKIVPDSWDWRDVNGENFVSPVRHQDMCGSCYIFASAAELEARIRITTHNKRQPILSTQQVVDCSPYSQGCAGGFPYLIAGKWAAEYGFVDESCYPYEGKDNVCRDPELEKYMGPEEVKNTNANGGFYSAKSNQNGDACYKNRYYSWMYKYVGWYFGNCNEEKMKEEIFKNGPVSVGFLVTDDFRYYKEGIYQHTGLKSRVNAVGTGFEETNHAVLIVGYGHCDKHNLDFWIVKNSWGENWGENGYFRIVRGRDEVAIESMAQGSLVVPPY